MATPAQKNPFDLNTGKATTYTPVAATTSTYKPAAATTSTYKADQADLTKWNVTDNQTVQGQLKGILAENSPLLQQAEAKANISANQRGLLNSSMAVGAAHGAVMDRALDIATPDAAIYADSAKFNAGEANTTERFNVDATNTANRFNTGERNTTSRFNTGETNTARRTNMTETNQNSRFNAGQTNDSRRFNANAQNEFGLKGIEAQYSALLQNSNNAAKLYSETTRTIAEIRADPNLDADAKQAAIDQQMTLLDNGLKLMGNLSGIQGIDDLVGDLTKPLTPGTTDPGSKPAPTTPPAGGGWPGYNEPTGGA